MLVSTIVIQDLFEGISEAADRLLQVQIHDGAQVNTQRRIYDSVLPDVSADKHPIMQTRIVSTGRRTLPAHDQQHRTAGSGDSPNSS